MFLQQALAENAGVLCPSVVSLKDLIAATANVEDLLKGQQGDAGKSPAEYLEEWLSGKELMGVTEINGETLYTARTTKVKQ